MLLPTGPSSCGALTTYTQNCCLNFLKHINPHNRRALTSWTAANVSDALHFLETAADRVPQIAHDAVLLRVWHRAADGYRAAATALAFF